MEQRALTRRTWPPARPPASGKNGAPVMAAGDSAAKGSRKEMAPGQAASVRRPRAAGPGSRPGTLRPLQGFWHLQTLNLGDCNTEGCYSLCKSICESEPGQSPAVELGKALYSSKRMRYADCAPPQQWAGSRREECYVAPEALPTFPPHVPVRAARERYARSVFCFPSTERETRPSSQVAYNASKNTRSTARSPGAVPTRCLRSASDARRVKLERPRRRPPFCAVAGKEGDA